MHALNLEDLTKRWRSWRELDRLQHSLGTAPRGGASGEPRKGDDARAGRLPDELIEPRRPRLD